jgi:hypothetical protein
MKKRTVVGCFRKTKSTIMVLRVDETWKRLQRTSNYRINKRKNERSDTAKTVVAVKKI